MTAPAKATGYQASISKANRGTLGKEYASAHNAMVAASVPASVARNEVSRNQAYFGGLGYSPNTPTRSDIGKRGSNASSKGQSRSESGE